MAKKKVTHHDHQPKDSNREDHTNHHKHDAPSDTVPGPQPAMEPQVSAEKLQSLKSLNSLLLKETVDRRHQVESLELAKVALEAELSRFGQEKRALEAEVASAGQRSVEMELEKAVVCVFLETQMGQMAAEFGKLEGERDAEVTGLKREVAKLAADLKTESAVLGEMIMERDSGKRELHSWMMKSEQLRAKLNEADEAGGILEDRLKKLEAKHKQLLREKFDGEKALEEARREKDSVEGDLARAGAEIGELKNKVELLLGENGEMEVEKRAQKVKIDELEKEVGELTEAAAGLRIEEQRLKLQVSELVKRCDEAEEKEKDMAREIEALIRDNKEKEAIVEALECERGSLEKRLKRFEKELEVKGRSMDEVLREKVKIEDENRGRLSEIAELNKEVVELRDAVSGLEFSCKNGKAKSESLQSEVTSQREAIDQLMLERDHAQKDLSEVREAVKSLKSEIVELERQIAETVIELKKMTSAHEELLLQKAAADHELELLRKEKGSVEKSLSESHRRTEELEAKINLTGLRSERALTFLKNTVTFLSKAGPVEEPKAEEDVQAYAKELETIKNAFRLKESVVDDLNRQLEFLQDSVAKAEKKKGFWTLVSSATTLFAAAAVAYIARAH